MSAMHATQEDQGLKCNLQKLCGFYYKANKSMHKSQKTCRDLYAIWKIFWTREQS